MNTIRQQTRNLVMQRQYFLLAQKYFDKHKIQYSKHPTCDLWLVLSNISLDRFIKACATLRASGHYIEFNNTACIGDFGEYC